MRHSSVVISALFYFISLPAFAEGPSTFYFWTTTDHFPKLHLANKVKASDPKAMNLLTKADGSSWMVLSPSPVTLRQQGGTDWVLLEIEIRPEFKTVDTDSRFFTDLGCPDLTTKTDTKSAECLKALSSQVSTLGVDGLKLATGQIILMNGKFFHSGEVKIFNHLSSDALQDRLRIQTLFYKADHDRFKTGLSESLFPSEINRLNPPFSGGGRGLLWDDLDGKPLDLGH